MKRALDDEAKPQQPQMKRAAEDTVAAGEETTRTFTLRCSRSSSSSAAVWGASDADLRAAERDDDAARMQSGRWVPRAAVDALWAQKDRLDALFAPGCKGGERLYYAARDRRFPSAKRGSSRFRNRAGDKLYEVLRAADVALRAGLLFVDVCGGPGAFSEVLLRTAPAPPPARGIGITLTRGAGGTENFYAWLARDARFAEVAGPTGTGDVYAPENLRAVGDAVRARRAEGADIVVADGGFGIGADAATGRRLDNLQELFSARLVLSELTVAARVLRPGRGSAFVCKLFDTFSDVTVSLLYAACVLFEEVVVVKPSHSRVVNSERYLACKHLRAGAHSPRPAAEGGLEWLVLLLEQIHAECVSGTTPRSVVPVDVMLADDAFAESVRAMNVAIAEQQTAALKLVLDDIDQEQAS